MPPPNPAPLTAEDHLNRAAHHRVIGSALADEGKEWAAVPLFYSAYHLARAALVSDPIFESPKRCSEKSVFLTIGDKEVTRHNARWRIKDGRRESRLWGVNDLVALLYPAISPQYELMHLASVDVRYGRGLTHPLERVCGALDHIAQHSAAGLLVAS